MYLRNYYEQKGYFLLEDTKQFKFKSLKKNKILNLEIRMLNKNVHKENVHKEILIKLNKI